MENGRLRRLRTRLYRKYFSVNTHIVNTYGSLRLGMGMVSIAYPFLLWWGGVLYYGCGRKLSISAYYASPMRDWFVGVLFLMGFALIAYRGYTKLEDYFLNFAGACAIGIAVIPTDANCCLDCAPDSAHGVLSILFFAAIILVMLTCSRVTLRKVRSKMRRNRYWFWYSLLILIIVFAGVKTYLLGTQHTPSLGHCKPNLFPWETTMVVTFGLYWLIKTWEIRASGFDRSFRHKTIRRELGLAPALTPPAPESAGSAAPAGSNTHPQHT